MWRASKNLPPAANAFLKHVVGSTPVADAPAAPLAGALTVAPRAGGRSASGTAAIAYARAVRSVEPWEGVCAASRIQTPQALAASLLAVASLFALSLLALAALGGATAAAASTPTVYAEASAGTLARAPAPLRRARTGLAERPAARRPQAPRRARVEAPATASLPQGIAVRRRSRLQRPRRR